MVIWSYMSITTYPGSLPIDFIQLFQSVYVDPWNVGSVSGPYDFLL